MVPLTLSFLALNLARSQAQEPSQVGLVVRFGDGQVETRCIEFNEPQISGYDVLLRSGLSVIVSGDVGTGSVVCSIGDAGCPIDNCWCQCKTMGSDCTYWSYWQLEGDWVYSQMGMSGHFVNHGEVEGWSWSEGSPPPIVAFEDICAPPTTDTPTPTVTSTPTPTPVPTDTPVPTATWTPSPTPLPPTDTPSPTDTPLPSATATITVTEGPVSTPSTEALMLAAPTPAASMTEVPEAAALPADPSISATDTETATPAPTVQSTETDGPENSQTPSPVPTAPPPTETPTVEAVVPPSQTSVPVALVTVSAGEGDAASSQHSGRGESGDGTNSLLAILSIGAGVAYLFFCLFVVILAAIFVVVRRRGQL